MPQLKPIGSSDAQPTPVAHTFAPRSVENGITTLVESQGGIPLGERRLTFSQNRTQSGRVKVTMKLSFPMVQDTVVNGVNRPTVVRTNYIDLSLNFDALSTQQERADMVQILHTLIHRDNTDVTGYVVGLEGFF